MVGNSETTLPMIRLGVIFSKNGVMRNFRPELADNLTFREQPFLAAILPSMRVLKSMEEANECTAIRLIEKRQRAKVGDIFRLSPAVGVYLWGRLIKRAQFFGFGL
jgi:hypothetical protein